MNNKSKIYACSGSVVIRVIICAVSLLIAGGVLVLSLRTFEHRKADDFRKALAISEYGIQAALEKIGEQPDWSEGFSKEPYEDGSYDVEVKREAIDGAVYLKLKSTGVIRSSVHTKEFTMRLEPPENDSSANQLFSAERDS
ncbi:MAG: hypothetical protein LBI42_12295 [Chitinispirillales bacterium]|jgi:hypothetical protein|nr:hypothetical protein [Chitinispirillales bacterium]